MLDLILDDGGGNDLVETKQGNLTKSLLGRNLPNCDVYNMDGFNSEVDAYEIYTDSEDEIGDGGGITCDTKSVTFQSGTRTYD